MIRAAIYEDIDAIVVLGLQMANESRYAGSGFCTKKAAERVKMLIDAGSGIALVAVKENKIVGFLIGCVARRFFSEQVYACEQGLFIEKGSRGSTLGYRLIKAYMSEAKKKGAEEINIGITTGVDEQRTAKLFEVVGFKPVGLVYSHQVTAEQS